MACLTALAGLVGLLPSGCDHLTVESFHGSHVLMTLSRVQPPAPGHHLELWVRDAASDDPRYQSVVRVQLSEGDGTSSGLAVAGHEADGSACLPADYYAKEPQFSRCSTIASPHKCLPSAFTVVPVLGPFHIGTGADGQVHALLDDPCVIDQAGNLLWTKEALDPATGTPQGELAAAAVQKRIDDLLMNPTASPSGPMLAFVPWDQAADNRPSLPADATPDERLCACRDYWNASAASYTGNPRQLTAPLHGALLGIVDYVSANPIQASGGIAFVVPWALQHARELWLTDTTAAIDQLDPAQIDCAAHPDTCRGEVLLDGNGAMVGRGAVHFELFSPSGGSESGSAAILTNLDQDPEQF